MAQLEAVRRKRRLQHWLAGMGKPSCVQQLADVRRVFAEDPAPCWAAVALLTLPREAVEEFVLEARREEDARSSVSRGGLAIGTGAWPSRRAA